MGKNKKLEPHKPGPRKMRDLKSNNKNKNLRDRDYEQFDTGYKG